MLTQSSVFIFQTTDVAKIFLIHSILFMVLFIFVCIYRKCLGKNLKLFIPSFKDFYKSMGISLFLLAIAFYLIILFSDDLNPEKAFVVNRFFMSFFLVFIFTIFITYIISLGSAFWKLIVLPIIEDRFGNRFTSIIILSLAEVVAYISIMFMVLPYDDELRNQLNPNTIQLLFQNYSFYSFIFGLFISILLGNIVWKRTNRLFPSFFSFSVTIGFGIFSLLFWNYQSTAMLYIISILAGVVCYIVWEKQELQKTINL